MAIPAPTQLKQQTLMTVEDLWRTPMAPDLVVEVISPLESSDDIQDKVVAYLAAGTRMLWVVYPRTRTVTVYRSLQNARILTAQENLSGEEVVPGFECRVSEIFL